MARFMMTLGLAAVLGSGTASAQVNMVGGAPGPSPLGLTSPLGLGAAAPVAPTGIPLGAVELVPQGTSPGATATGLATSDIAVCSGFGGSIPETSFGAPMTGTSSATSSTMPSGLATVFDGGTTGTASGTCTSGVTTALARPTASASSPTGMGAAAPVGRVGIPMGSTELGAGGLSPAPLDVTGSISPLLSTSSSSAVGTATSMVGAPVSTSSPVSTPSSTSSSASSQGTGGGSASASSQGTGGGSTVQSSGKKRR